MPAAALKRRSVGRPKGSYLHAHQSGSEKLAAVALELFAERGFHAVTIKAIGDAAGVNAAMIYYYFDNKEDLFRASIERAVDQAFEHFASLRTRHDNPKDVIEAWLGTHVELFATIRRMVKVSLDYKSSPLSLPSVDRCIARFYEQEEEVLVSCIRQGIELGIFDPPQCAPSIAKSISTFLDGAMIRSYIVPGFDIEESIAAFGLILWDLLGFKQRSIS
ncbi:MAG: TetR/AcrR family transcriptional regulator [Kiloniellales bacterium]|nr:TetR/AcrR family transcriptional regulator [Kiloniellales bacterium]